MSYKPFTDAGKGFGIPAGASKGYNAAAPSDTAHSEGSVFAFKIVDTAKLFLKKDDIQKMLFDSIAGDSNDIEFSVNESSGHISWLNREKMYSKNPPDIRLLPQTAEKATTEAFNFINEKYTLFDKNYSQFEPLVAPGRAKGNVPIRFNILPNPAWLIHAQTVAVKSSVKNTADHWLVTYVIKIKTPDNKKYPVLYASIDVRVGAKISALNGYQIIGYVQKWRPIYECFKVEQYLPDTGDPTEDGEEEDYSEPAEDVRLAYILSDENYKQNNLLPYEVAAEDDEISVLPASTMSIWADFTLSDSKLYALIQGTSSDIEVNWIAFSYFDLDANLGLVPSLRREKAQVTAIDNFLGKNLFVASCDDQFFKVGQEIVLEVTDTGYGNTFTQHITLNIVPQAIPVTLKSEAIKSEAEPETITLLG